MTQDKPLSYFEEHEKAHGRHSSWYVYLFDATSSYKPKEWKGLKRFIHVHKYTLNLNDNSESHSDRLYISDLFETDAEFFHKGIRGHWTIENSSHWVKDVIHKEDNNRITKDNGPVNSAVFSSIAINISRKNATRSITENQTIFNINFKELFDKIRT